METPPWVFFMFFKLYKWYKIAQRTTYLLTSQLNTINHTKYALPRDIPKTKVTITVQKQLSWGIL